MATGLTPTGYTGSSNTITASSSFGGTNLSKHDMAREAVFMNHLAPHGWKMLHDYEKNFSDVALVCDVCDEVMIKQSFDILSIGDHSIQLMIEDSKQRLSAHSQVCKESDDVSS